MKNKPTPGPPTSIEYFEGEISKVMKISTVENAPAEYQGYLLEIAAKLGPGADGWMTLQGLLEDEADEHELVWRYSRGKWRTMSSID